MNCSQCGAQVPETADFCPNCGARLSPAPPSQTAAAGPQPPRREELASLGQRVGSLLIDLAVGVIPFVGYVVVIGNLIANRRGMTLGLSLVHARIVRANGDVSGFFHTVLRSSAAFLSLLPLGLGYWWAFWDPHRQTWHDKIMNTYVVKNEPRWGVQAGTSSTAAVVLYWLLIAVWVGIVLLVFAYFASTTIPFRGGAKAGTGASERYEAGVGQQNPIMATREHIAAGQTARYSTTPPTSGNHWARPADCGFYTAGLPDEQITHNLEHSNIVVSYNLSTQEEVAQLRKVLGSIDLNPRWGVTRFYDKLEPGTVAVATWGVLDIMKGIDRDRIKKFFDTYAGRLGPERIPC